MISGCASCGVDIEQNCFSNKCEICTLLESQKEDEERSCINHKQDRQCLKNHNRKFRYNYVGDIWANDMVSIPIKEHVFVNARCEQEAKDKIVKYCWDPHLDITGLKPEIRNLEIL